MTGPVLRPFAWACVIFAALALVVTWPQARHLGTHASNHHDIYFNMWRMGWVAHALAEAPASVLDGNIFHPERRTLTYSDAMPVVSVVATPLLWLDFPPVLVHNIVLLLGIVLSGAGMFVLARELTGSNAGALVAGIIFAFAPYRFAHYMHMELQWTVWIPWAFWALHRAVLTGNMRYGLLLGLFGTLQMMSSIYYGVFLWTLFAVAAAVLLLMVDRAKVRRSIVAVAAGATLSVIASGLYALPYLDTRTTVVERSVSEIDQFSAIPASYVAASDTNLLYGKASRIDEGQERRLFPGVLAVLLALFGIGRRSRVPFVLAATVCGLVAFDLSFGRHGHLFGYLYDNVSVFHAFRAVARFGIFVLFFLALLAAQGAAEIVTRLSRRGTVIAGAGLVAVLLMEYWVAPLHLVAYPNEPPPIYQYLARRPPGILIEFPVPRADSLPGDDARAVYASTFHWNPLLNGYSGHYPLSYLKRLEALQTFPSDAAIRRLQADGARYVLVHTTGYRPSRIEHVLDALRKDPRLTEIARFRDSDGPAVLFELRQVE